jgi:hypothetical protein
LLAEGKSPEISRFNLLIAQNSQTGALILVELGGVNPTMVDIDGEIKFLSIHHDENYRKIGDPDCKERGPCLKVMAFSDASGKQIKSIQLAGRLLMVSDIAPSLVPCSQQDIDDVAEIIKEAALKAGRYLSSLSVEAKCTEIGRESAVSLVRRFHGGATLDDDASAFTGAQEPFVKISDRRRPGRVERAAELAIHGQKGTSSVACMGGLGMWLAVPAAGAAGKETVQLAPGITQL